MTTDIIDIKKHAKMQELRDMIDSLDAELLQLLAKRIDVIKQAGSYKKIHDLPELDEDRWQQVLKTRLEQAERLKLPPEFVTDLLELIHSYTLKIETDIKRQ